MSTETELKRSARSRNVALALALFVFMCYYAMNHMLAGGTVRRRVIPAAGSGYAEGYDGVEVGSIWVPIGVKEAHEGAGDPSWRVTMCLVEWDAYWRAPHDFGKFKQVQMASDCGSSGRQQLVIWRPRRQRLGRAPWHQ